jgi:hypothetical protein
VKREDREALFNEYVDEMRAAEQEAERAAKAKREEEVYIKLISLNSSFITILDDDIFLRNNGAFLWNLAGKKLKSMQYETDVGKDDFLKML